MTTTNDNGGPAFPEVTEACFGTIKARVHVSGMTLLDYFAGQALAPLVIGIEINADADGGVDYAVTAEAAYDIAEAMLAERRRRAEVRPDDQATHRCKVCGARWRLNPPSQVQPGGSWSLAFGQNAGPCCDNVAMGEQIEALP